MSGVEYPVADQIIDINDLLRWVRHARAEIASLRAERDAAEQRGADRMREAIVSALCVQAEAARLRGVKIAGMDDAEHAAFLALGNTARMAAFDRAVEIARAGGAA